MYFVITSTSTVRYDLPTILLSDMEPWNRSVPSIVALKTCQQDYHDVPCNNVNQHGTLRVTNDFVKRYGALKSVLAVEISIWNMLTRSSWHTLVIMWIRTVCSDLPADLVRFGIIWLDLVRFGQIWSDLVRFGQIWIDWDVILGGISGRLAGANHDLLLA